MAETRRRNPISDCPLTAALAALGGKWKMIIVYWLAESPRHFAALRELVADEMVIREETGPAPAPVIYSLSDYGRAMMPLIEQVRQMGRAHIVRFGGE